MKTTNVIRTNHTNISSNDADAATPLQAVGLLLEVRLGRASASTATKSVLEEKSRSLLDTDGGITKEAYASASPELIALAREDRRQRNQAKVRAGVLCEYVLNGFPEKTEWRALQEWLIDQNLHPVQVVVPKTGDYAFVLLPVDDSEAVETLFQGPEPARFKGVALRVRKNSSRP